MTPEGERAVWVTRPEPGNGATASFLRGHGFHVLAVPVLVTAPVPYRPPPGGPPHWIVFVSANAVRGFGTGPAAAEAKASARAACVGSRTAALARAAGWKVDLVPAGETARGLSAALDPREWRGRRVWIPAGDREGSARTVLPRALEEAGAAVSVFGVYRTSVRAPSSRERAGLAAALPEAAVFHSPSAVDAVFAPGAPPEFLPWRAARAVAVGPTTAARLQEAGAARIAVAPAPSDPGILEALRAG